MHSRINPSPWLTCPRQDSAAPVRLWCFPFAGGGAAAWRPWAFALAGVAEIIAVRAPGREDRFDESPLVRLNEIVARMVESIAPHVNENYVLCGLSLGGLVAFELARAIRARGLNMPRGLIVGATRAPHHPPDSPLMHRLPDDQFIREIERRYGAFDATVRNEPGMLELMIPPLRADVTAYETYTYTPGEPLDIPILALAGTTDTTVSQAQVADWWAYTKGRFEFDVVAGDHFFAHENLEATTARVRTFLQHVAGRAC